MILASYIGYHLVAKLNLQCRTSRTWSGKFLASFVDPKVRYCKKKTFLKKRNGPINKTLLPHFVPARTGQAA